MFTKSVQESACQSKVPTRQRAGKNKAMQTDKQNKLQSVQKDKNINARAQLQRDKSH